MMREEILEAAAQVTSPEDKLGALRECIQAATLRSLHEAGAFSSLCLTGKAAERFACGSADYAEGLDFLLVDKAGYSPEKWLFKAQRYLRFMGLDARIAFARKAASHAGWVKVTGLLAEAGLAASAGLSPLPAETIGFRIVIDISPIDAAMCKVKLADVAGESFAVRYKS